MNYPRLEGGDVTSVQVDNCCPDCGVPLTEGPHGGLSINRYCSNPRCGSRFNDMGPFGVERISDRSPRGAKE